MRGMKPMATLAVAAVLSLFLLNDSVFAHCRRTPVRNAVRGTVHWFQAHKPVRRTLALPLKVMAAPVRAMRAFRCEQMEHDTAAEPESCPCTDCQCESGECGYPTCPSLGPDLGNPSATSEPTPAKRLPRSVPLRRGFWDTTRHHAAPARRCEGNCERPGFAAFNVPDDTASASTSAAKRQGWLRRAIFAGAVRRAHEVGKINDADYAAFRSVFEDAKRSDKFFQLLADYRMAETGANAFPDGILKLLQWITDNWDSIAKIIEFVIKLIAQDMPPQPMAALSLPAMTMAGYITPAAYFRVQDSIEPELLVPLYPFEFEDAIDGDTLAGDIHLCGLELRLTNQRIRMLEINAPEMHGDTRPAAIKSRLHLLELVDRYKLQSPAQLMLHVQGRDHFGRVLAHVYGRDEGEAVNLNRRMVADGFAEAYRDN